MSLDSGPTLFAVCASLDNSWNIYGSLVTLSAKSLGASEGGGEGRVEGTFVNARPPYNMGMFLQLRILFTGNTASSRGHTRLTRLQP